MIVFDKTNQQNIGKKPMSADSLKPRQRSAAQNSPTPIPAAKKPQPQQPQASIKDNSSALASGISSLSDYVTKPLTDKIYKEIDKVTDDIRYKLAKEKGIQPPQVKQLEVAEYLMAMPTAGLNKPIADMSASIRNSILIGFAGVCIVLYITRSKDEIMGKR